MDFGDKLNLLLKTLKVNNSKLAKALKIDPSLVSKWRNKKRIPSAVSPYILDMADYLTGLQLHASQKKQLIQLLEEHAVLTEPADPTAVQEAIARWLSPEVNEQEGTVSYLPPPTANLNATSSFVNIFSGIFTEPTGSNGPVAPKPGIDKTKAASAHVSSHQFELYRGRAGKRDAVLAFLDLVLASNEPLELLLTSQEDSTWIMEDVKFAALWGYKLGLLLEQGHKITIIHNTDRPLPELIAIMKYWLPLHLTGNVESFYYPKYVHNIIKATYFIIKDKACIVSFSPEDITSEGHSFFFQDPLVTATFQAGFYAFLLQCKKLLHTFTREQMLPFMEKMVQLEGSDGDILTYKSHLSSITIPPALYEDILKSNSIPPQEMEERLKKHEKRLDNFAHMTKHYSYREIFPQNVFLSLPGATENQQLSAMEAFSKSNLALTSQQLAAWLEHTIQVLQENDRYEIFLTGETESHHFRDMNIGFIYKENHAAVATTHASPHKGPTAIMSSEGNITLAFEQFFQGLLTEIPAANRSKKHIITRLEKVLTGVRGY